MRCSPTSRAISGIGGSRDRKMRFMPCGISRRPSANAKRHAGSALGSWKLSTTSTAPGGKQREELAHEAPRERRQVARVLRGEHGQRRGFARPAARQVRRRRAQVVEERRRVGVARIGLEPQPGQLARLDVACDERGLARARRPGDPQDGMRAALVEQSEQALTLLDVVQPRPAELGERGDGRRAAGGPRHQRIGRTGERASMRLASASTRDATSSISSRRRRASTPRARRPASSRA